MEVIMMEARTYEAMMERFEQFVQKMDALCQRHSGDTKKWLDSQDVCIMLNVSKRTLQSLRNSGKLGYSMIGHKIYYRPQDVQQLIENAYRKRGQHE